MKRKRKMLVLVLGIVLIVAVVLYLVFGTKLAGLSATVSPVRINEVMASNKGTVPDDNGNYSDWVELYNSSSEDVDISNYALTDDAVISGGVVGTYTAKWAFPDGTVIPAGGYLVVYCSGDASEGGLHTSFKLSTDDALVLTDVSGTVLDSAELRAVGTGMSYGRNTEGTFEEMQPSPGYPNTAEGVALFLNSMTAAPDSDENIGVYINEFMPSNASTLRAPDGTYSDWIELYNSNGYEVDISGYGISDTTTQPLKYVFPEGTKIEAYGYLLIYCTGNKGTSNTTIEVPFGLRSYEEAVVFSSPKGHILDSHEYSRAESDHSYIRTVYGEDYWEETTSPTPGYANNAAGISAYQATLNYGKGEVVISELMNGNKSFLAQADGSYPDWIEIHNTTGQAINLSGYALSKNPKNPAKWVFPDVTLGAGEYLVVLCTGNNVKDPSATLQTNFGISKEGDTVYLFNPDAEIIDKVEIGAAHNDISVGRDATGTMMYYATATPGTANTGGVPGYAETPEFSLAAGIYTENQTVEITVPDGAQVYYTTDGSIPSSSSTLYTGAISFGAGCNVLRAVTVRNGYFDSDVASATYLINTGGTTADDHMPTLPVISLISDPDYFFGSVRGIYVAGADYQNNSGGMDSWASYTITDGARNKYWKYANFNAQHVTHPDPMGLEWERPTHVDYIGLDGSLLYEGDLMCRIFGAYSRYEAQKSFALVARTGYGDSSINYPFFENRDATSYKSLVLRCAAQDWKFTKLRENTIQGLLEESGSQLPTQAYVQVAVYINGTYWGVYNLREKVNKYFIAQHYNVSADSVDLLVGNGSTTQAVISGDKDSYKDYQALVEYAGSHDLSVQANYDYVCSLMDVDNFAEYCALEIYVGNTDTGNIKFWRSSELDNKWRWIPYDFDWAFNYDSGESSLESTTGWRRDFFSKYFNEKGHGAGKGFSTVLSRALLKNASFRALFLQKCAMMMEVYETDKMKAWIDDLAAKIDGEMQYDCPRWGTERYTTWQTRVNRLKESAEKVPEYFLYYCQKYFSLSDSEMKQVFGRTSSLKSVS